MDKIDKDQVIAKAKEGLKVFRSKLDQIPALEQAEVRRSNCLKYGGVGNATYINTLPFHFFV